MTSLSFSPGPRANVVRDAKGQLHQIPPGWECLPPGDAGLTRRVKAAATTWSVTEKLGRKTFSRGVWAPPGVIAAARATLDVERESPEYARKRAGDVQRRAVAHQQYVADFEVEVLTFLAFAPRYQALAATVAKAVTAHATPVGSGTVARTKRIEIDERAEAAVIAWLRHQTTAYDSMQVARVKGARRALRRELAGVSRRLLNRHRGAEPGHETNACPLCRFASV